MWARKGISGLCLLRVLGSIPRSGVSGEGLEKRGLLGTVERVGNWSGTEEILSVLGPCLFRI